MQRPASLLYGVDDIPPPLALLMLAWQHIFLMCSTLVMPIVLVTEIGGGAGQVQGVLAATMVAAGLGTVLQSIRFWGIGSGFLCPNLAGPNFFAACMNAAWLGGLPLMRGMIIAAGLTELVLARILPRLSFLFPPAITGLVVFMVAVGLMPVGISRFFRVNFDGEAINGANVAVASLTLLLMIGVNVWGSVRLKLYALLIGLVAGYALSVWSGLIDAGSYHQLADAPWIGLPSYDGMFAIDFAWELLPAFVIVSLSGAVKSIGNLVMCERINDEGWTRPDLRRVGDGLTADAISVTAAGLLGGMATDTSASNVGLSNASGATSRWIGVAAGVLFALLGFSPKVAAFLSVMPQPVAGAVVLFVVCFMFMSGIQMMMSSKPDMAMTFVIGLSLAFGLSVDVLPSIFSDVPSWARPILGSSLTVATLLAIGLHQLFRLGRPPPAEGTSPLH